MEVLTSDCRILPSAELSFLVWRNSGRIPASRSRFTKSGGSSNSKWTKSWRKWSGRKRSAAQFCACHSTTGKTLRTSQTLIWTLTIISISLTRKKWVRIFWNYNANLRNKLRNPIRNHSFQAPAKWKTRNTDFNAWTHHLRFSPQIWQEARSWILRPGRNAAQFKV